MKEIQTKNTENISVKKTIDNLITKVNKTEIDDRFIIDSGKECINHCPYETIRPKIELTGNAVLKLRYLQEKYPDVEFLVYGNAVKVDNEAFTYVLDDIVIPEQVVRPAAVDNISLPGIWNTVIHKHPGEATGFSHTDEEFVNSNHEFSIVIGNNNKLKNSNGTACLKIECGRFMKAALVIDISIPKSKDADFIKSTEKIKVSMDSSHNVFSKFIGANKKQETCKRCKQPLEKTAVDKEWYCQKCQIVYII